jgi:hypothetical protein
LFNKATSHSQTAQKLVNCLVRTEPQDGYASDASTDTVGYTSDEDQTSSVPTPPKIVKTADQDELESIIKESQCPKIKLLAKAFVNRRRLAQVAQHAETPPRLRK